MEIKRFGVSLEEELLYALDHYSSIKRFANRSQAIRHLIRSNLTEEKIGQNNTVAGAIVIVYDHHHRELNGRLMEVQHDFHGLILSTQHVHLAHDLCLETIIVKGPSLDLTDLADRIIGLKGIRHGKLVMTGLE